MKKSQTIIVSIAIGILMIIAFSFWGFSGIGKTKTVKNMTNSEKSLIANSFNIVLDNDENISKFTRNESNGDYYYSIFINNITDMEQFKKTNNNIQYFVEKKIS